MNQALQIQLVHRVLAHLEHCTTDTAAAPSRLPTTAYTDPARHAREHARLFRQLPVAIGHGSQLPAAGDFFTHDLSGVPLLVVRGDDGRLAAFLNVCRHRGTRVEPAPCGAAKAFVCPYHAWSYGRDGKNLAKPHAAGFAGIGARDLLRVPIAEVAGLIFVRPEPGEEPAFEASVRESLGPIVSELEGFGTATAHIYAPQTQIRELSWKLAIDVFLETYHLRTAHKDSIYRLFFDNLGLVDPIGAHVRTVFPKRTIRELAAAPEASWELRRHANILYHVFPSTLILVEPDHVAVLHLWPMAADRTLLQSYTLLGEPATTEKARSYWDANNAILYGAIAEDFALGESIQRGLAHHADVVFGTFEHALAHFHAQIDRAVS